MLDALRFLRFVNEAPRFAVQIGKTILELSDLKKLPQGDGHPIVFLPGFATGNGSTFFMRRSLSERGHNTIRWCGGHNLGITEQLVGDIVHQVNSLAWHYNRPVSLVGQSLGGSIARVVANMIPDDIKCVVTLGSPINGIAGVLDQVKTMYDTRTVGTLGAEEAWKSYHSMIVNNPPVPSTSIYSKVDGIVHWSESIQPVTELSENVEVKSSHLSMGFDVDVIQIIADRVTQSTDNWEKYK